MSFSDRKTLFGEVQPADIPPANLSLYADMVGSGTFPGLMSFAQGVEIYHPSSIPFVDFHRAANPAGDAGADYNVRLINDSANVLSLHGGQFIVHGGTAIVQNSFIGNSPAHGSGFAQFGHKNMTSAGNFGFLHSNVGETIVNAPAGQVVKMRNNNTDIVHFAPTDVWFNRPINLAGNKIWTKAINDDAHRIQFSPGLDSLEFWSWNQHRFVIQNTLRAVIDGDIWTSGRFTGNHGGSGPGFRSRSGGNTISFNWWGGFEMWVDVTHVKTFVIDHPVENTKYLVHGTLEGPEAGVYYRGQGQLSDGWAEVTLPDYFEALCAEEGRSVMLTCIADDPADEWCPVLHATYPKGGRFYVGLGSGMVINDQRFWWEVKAVRRDVPALVAEPLKKAVTVAGEGPYTYLKGKA